MRESFRLLGAPPSRRAVLGFLGSASTDKVGAGKLLFAGLFDTLNAERSSIMNGLERVMRKQREAADKIRSDTIALQEKQSSQQSASSSDSRASAGPS